MAKKGGAKKKPAMAKHGMPAEEKKPAEDDPKVDLASVRLEGPYPNGKAYIRHKVDGKLKCLVNLEKKCCKNNGEVMKKVLDYIKKNPGCRKSDAVAEKMRLIKKK